MPDIKYLFDPKDPGFLRMVAQVWGVEELDCSFDDLLSKLVATVEKNEILGEVLELLPESAKKALLTLAVKGGKIPWADFRLKFGTIREMGAARRDREHPDLHPESVAEMLYYRGLMGRVFLDKKPEPREFAFIPDEILKGIQQTNKDIKIPPGRPSLSESISHYKLVDDSILQDICTLLASLRLGTSDEKIALLPLNTPEKEIRVLLRVIGLVDSQDLLRTEPVKKFLELPRSQALYAIAKTWKKSTNFNDLRLLHELTFEGNWQNDPIPTKEFILQLLSQIPQKTWWDLKSFIEYVHSQYPNFLRPSGDFDSWSIRDTATGQYLRGFDSWNEVEGRLIQYLLTGPLHWLGYLDLGCSDLEGESKAFRLSRWWQPLSQNQPPAFNDPQPEDVFITTQGKVMVPFTSPLSVRYQIARFCELSGKNRQAYSYQVSHQSLKKATAQGLKVGQLVKIIQNHSTTPFPPSLLKALQKWEKAGTQAQFDNVHILRFSDPSLLNVLIKSKAARFIVESLNPTTIADNPAGEKIIKAVLLDAGYFSEGQREKEV